MIKRFKSFIDKEFANYPESKELAELKEELVGVLMEKYKAATDAGKGELDAYSETVSSMSDLREQYKDQMSALQFTVKEVVDKSKIVLVCSLWYYIGLLIIFLCLKFFAPTVDLMPKYPDTNGIWIVFPFGAFLYVIGLMSYMCFNAKLSRRKIIRHLAIGVIPMMLAIIIFLSLGFWAKMWHPAWLVFLAAPAVSSVLDGITTSKSKIGKIIKCGIGGFIVLVALQLFLMLTGVWPTSWILYIVLAFFGLVALSVLLVRKK